MASFAQRHVLYLLWLIFTSSFSHIGRVNSSLSSTSTSSFCLETNALSIDVATQGGTVLSVLDKLHGGRDIIAPNSTTRLFSRSFISAYYDDDVPPGNGISVSSLYQNPDSVILRNKNLSSTSKIDYDDDFSQEEQEMVATWKNAKSGHHGVGLFVTISVIHLTEDRERMRRSGTEGSTSSNDDLLMFKVKDVSGSWKASLRSLFFANIPLHLPRCAAVPAAAFTEENRTATSFGVLVQPIDLFSEVGGFNAATLAQCECNTPTTKAEGGIVLRGEVDAVSGMVGHGVVLWAGAGGKQGVQAAIQRIELLFNLPSPTIDGKWAKTAPEVKAGYFLVHVLPETLNQTIYYAKAAGIQYIMFLSSWVETTGHYNASTTIWGGMEGLKKAVAEIKHNGLKAGIHTMSANIAFNDAYVTPVPDPRLAKTGGHTLSANVTATATWLPSLESTANLPEKYGSLVPKAGLDMLLDEEIITYDIAMTTPPYGLTGCRRGSRGTRKSAHQAGIPMYHLTQMYNGYLPNPNTTLLREVASNLARTYVDAGFSMVYFDGLESLIALGNSYFPGESVPEAMFHQGFWDGVKQQENGANTVDILAESSSGSAGGVSSFRWHMNTRSGQSDWAATNPRLYFDFAKAPGVARTVCGKLMTADLGWWGYLLWTPAYHATLPQEIAYMAAKSVGWQAAPNFELVSMDTFTGNGRTGEALSLLKLWQSLNMSNQNANKKDNIFELLQAADTDFVLSSAASMKRRSLRHDSGRGTSEIQNKKQFWWISPAHSHLPHVADPLQSNTRKWTVPSSFTTASIVGVRVKALTAVTSTIGDKSGHNVDLLLLNSSSSVVRTTKCEDRNWIYLNAAIGPHEENGRSVETLQLRYVAPSTEAVGCFRQRFAVPLNLSTHRAMGIQLYGDGSGALVDIQLEDASVPCYRDYYLTVTWIGWKNISLQVPETKRLFEHAGGHFPTPPAAKLSMRNFEWSRVLGVNIYITASTKATLYIRALEGLQETSAEFGNGAELWVGTVVLGLPASLQGTPCLATTNNVSGCADYMECEDITNVSTCRAFDANNWPIAIPFPKEKKDVQSFMHRAPPSSLKSYDISFHSSTLARAEVTLIEKSSTRYGPFPENE